MKNTVKYKNLLQLTAKVGILPMPDSWRLVAKPRAGRIPSLPHFAGLPVATNGVLLAIQDEEGAIRFGHKQWFVANPRRQRRPVGPCFRP